MKTPTLIMALFMLFKPLIPIMEYVVFYDYIKNELCINKDNTEMGCNGMCFLTEEMNKASDITPGNDKKVSLYDSMLVYCETPTDKELFLTPIAHSSKQASSYNNLYVNMFCSDILRPPIV